MFVQEKLLDTLTLVSVIAMKMNGYFIDFPSVGVLLKSQAISQKEM